ncbi:MAG: hypothetical protein KatS3mg037_2900 [Ignavibacterium sp.]|jgi:hypothetical protein|nr:MAG: hypothetical protein KatS3mg037_2900 [Ignavibacterium sp.]
MLLVIGQINLYVCYQMMKKKIEIISLSLLLFVSTTGIPMYYHYCQMMEQTSMNSCDVCSVELNEEQSSCCSENSIEGKTIISSENSDCCQINFIYLNVDDQFLLIKTELANRTSNFEVIINFLTDNILTEHFTKRFFFKDLSPPTFNKPDIYLSNHSFLI